ncbi:hypothetical protein KCU65_g2623, partial [Aureobasidium melanogenum]
MRSFAHRALKVNKRRMADQDSSALNNEPSREDSDDEVIEEVGEESLTHYEHQLAGFFDRTIVDEAHKAKNNNTKVHKALIEACANHHILITGTPITVFTPILQLIYMERNMDDETEGALDDQGRPKKVGDRLPACTYTTVELMPYPKHQQTIKTVQKTLSKHSAIYDDKDEAIVDANMNTAGMRRIVLLAFEPRLRRHEVVIVQPPTNLESKPSHGRQFFANLLHSIIIWFMEPGDHQEGRDLQYPCLQRLTVVHDQVLAGREEYTDARIRRFVTADLSTTLPRVIPKNVDI